MLPSQHFAVHVLLMTVVSEDHNNIPAGWIVAPVELLDSLKNAEATNLNMQRSLIETSAEAPVGQKVPHNDE